MEILIRKQQNTKGERMNKTALVTCLLLLFVSCLCSGQRDLSKLTGPYLGQKLPGKSPERFGDSLLSTLYSFHKSVIVFSPDGKEAYWQARAIPEIPNTLGDEAIFESKYIDGHWSAPLIAPFSMVNEGDTSPFISPDGKKFYFISERHADGMSSGCNIWVMDRMGKGWSEPRLLPPRVNAMNIMGSLSVDGEYNLYFSVWNTSTTTTNLDIYRSVYMDGDYCVPEKLGAEINDNDARRYTGSPFISPDGSYLIFWVFASGKNRLHISYRKKGGSWTKARDLSGVLGADTDCDHPYVTPDGKYLLFQFLWNEYSFPKGFGWIQASFIEELRPSR